MEKQNKSWVMPNWMIDYCDKGLLIYGKEQVEGHMNMSLKDIQHNEVLKLTVNGTKNRVNLLTCLYKEGKIK